MRKSIFTLATTLAISTLPVLAHADVNIVNNTNTFATGYTAYSPCSSTAGDRGIIKPHSVFSVPQYVIAMWCGAALCDVQVYGSKSCTGKRIATITIDGFKGIVGVTNYDKEHYSIAWNALNITVNPT